MTVKRICILMNDWRIYNTCIDHLALKLARINRKEQISIILYDEIETIKSKLTEYWYVVVTDFGEKGRKENEHNLFLNTNYKGSEVFDELNNLGYRGNVIVTGYYDESYKFNYHNDFLSMEYVPYYSFIDRLAEIPRQ